ncbi:Uma2 family endonuclease, partial [bacterium]|nr:Uma2 family endonuclease [bacterium]
PDTVQAPDVAYVSEKKLRECPTKDWNKFLELSPDLVVEVLSPGNTVSEMLTKITNYFEAGTELLWVVDPKTKTVTVYESLKSIQVLTKEETLTGGKVLEGFELVLSELFEQEKF